MSELAPSTAPPRQEDPLHVRLRRAAYGLACIPHPGRPLTDDHAADVIAASQLMLSASFELADAEEERTRRKAFGARCERIAVAAFIALAAVFLTVAIVGITLDATH